MIDYLALALTHGLLIVMLMRLIGRDGADVEPIASAEVASVEAEAKPPATGAAERRAARERRRHNA